MWHCTRRELRRVVLVSPLLLVEMFWYLSKWSLNKIVSARLNKSSLTYITCPGLVSAFALFHCHTFDSSKQCLAHASSRVCAVSCYIWRNTQSLQQIRWGVTIRYIAVVWNTIWCNKSLTSSKNEKWHRTPSLWIFFPGAKKKSHSRIAEEINRMDSQTSYFVTVVFFRRAS